MLSNSKTSNMKLAFADIGNTTALQLSKDNLQPLQVLLKAKMNVVCFFSNIQSQDLLAFLLNYTGKCKLSLSSYALSERAVNWLHKAQLQELITELNIIVDWRIRQSNPQLIQHLQKVCNNFSMDNYHAKIWLLENEHTQLCCIGSINIGHNARKEAISIFNNKAIFQTFKSAFNESFKAKR